MLQVLVNVFLESFPIAEKACGYAKRRVMKKWISVWISKTMGT
jgi:hypothetical protein